MNCKEAKEIAAGFLPGDLSDAEKADYLAHLNGCESCRNEDALLAKSWQALDMYKAPILGDGFVDSLMARIRSGQTEEKYPVFVFNPFGLSASARAALAGWWKVLAFTLASCAVYLICIETGVMPSRQYLPPASAVSQSGSGTFSTMFSDSQDSGGGHLLAIMEGADK